MADSPTIHELNDRLRSAPVDERAAAALADRGLRLSVFGPEADEAADWLQAVARGFLESEMTTERVTAARGRLAGTRMIGVYDEAAPMPLPVGTFATWATELSLPGDRVVPACAVSDVTVSPTHRRRGIARSMMEGELRAARASGLPVAALTASESGIYQRYGFAPAADAVRWAIDPKRAGWNGPAAPGRVDFIPRERFRELAPALHDRIRISSPGEVVVRPGAWDGFAGMTPSSEHPERLRFAQYAGVDGRVDGLIVYTPSEGENDYARSKVSVSMLLTATDDAYAGLWGWLMSMDLIGEITADLRRLDEPLRWMVRDQRAMTTRVTDHQYVRVLDVEAALAARSYPAAGRLVLEVDDPLGIDGGRFLLETGDDGEARVVRDAAAEAPVVRIGTVELSALLVGGVRAATLAAAGRLTADDVDLVDDVFRSRVSPLLSFWY